MKRIVLSILAAGLAAPAFAADPMERMYYEPETASPVSGSIGASGGALLLETDGESDTATAYNVSGKLNYRFNPNWNGQFDARLNGLSADGSHLNTYGGGVHLFWRDPAAYAIGGFASIDWLDFDYLDGTAHSWRAGPEFQIYRGNMTYYGQAFAGKYDVEDESANVWGVRGEARYFHTENLRFEGELGFTRLSGDGGEIDILTAGLEVEKRFDNSPFSVWGRYKFDHISSGDVDGNGHTFLAGFRAAFGTDTLLDEDRNGASMEIPETSIY